MSPKKDDWVRVFDVSEPTRHKKGYTVYKVTSKVYPRHSPEAVTEVIVYKRYSDFKKLHVSLSALHAGLHLGGEFPTFAKSRLFGRFDEVVIKERTQSALSLLEFAAKFSPLFTSQVFVKFFEGGLHLEPGRELDSLKDDVLLPITSQHAALTSQVSLDLLDDNKASVNFEHCDAALGGVWQHRQSGDNISLDSNDTGDGTDEESLLSTPLTNSDLSFFDPLEEKRQADSKNGQYASNIWLLNALTACAELEAESLHSNKSELDGEPFKFPKAFADFDELDFSFNRSENNSTNFVTDNHPSTIVNQSGQINVFSLDTNNFSGTNELMSQNASKDDFLNQFDPLFCSNSPDQKVELITDDNDSPKHENKLESPKNFSQWSSSSSSRISSSCTSPTKTSPRRTLQSGDEGDYLFQAANHISLAQQHEANGNYELAFQFYKAGVGTLLTGVQGDNNKARRDAVRRKTAQYLVKAEDLYKNHIAISLEDEYRWADDSKLSPSSDIDPSVKFLQGSKTELKNFKVLGVIDKVLLVLDTTTDVTYVMKVLYKMPSSSFQVKSINTIVPTSVPYMVQLYKFYETDYAIFLLLQYASGGKLWNYISSYLMQNPISPLQESQGSNVFLDFYVSPTDSSLNQGNIYIGKKLIQENSSTKSSQPLNTNFNLHLNGDESDPSSVDSDLFVPAGCTDSYVELFTNYASALYSEKTVVLAKCHLAPSRTQSANNEITKVNKNNLCGDEKNYDQLLNDSFLVSNSDKPSLFSIDGLEDDETLQNNSDSIQNNSKNFQIQEKYIENKLLVDSKTSDKTNDSNAMNNSGRIDGLSHINLMEIDNWQDVIHLDPDILISSARQLIKAVDETLEESNRKVSNILEYHENSPIEEETSNTKEMSSPILNHSSSILSNTDCVEKKICSSPNQVNSPRSSPFHKSIWKSREISRTNHINIGEQLKSRTRTLSSVFGQLDLASSRGSKSVHLPEQCIRIWAAELALTLNELHKQGIICKDLRPDNILLGEKGHVLLTYFSQWNCVEQTFNQWTFDNLYAAPELLSLNEPTPCCDWWSLGALIFELLTGETLISWHPAGIISHTQLNIPEHVSPEAQSLLIELLRYNPNERLGSRGSGLEDIKAHPFFDGLDWNKLHH